VEGLARRLQLQGRLQGVVKADRGVEVVGAGIDPAFEVGAVRRFKHPERVRILGAQQDQFHGGFRDGDAAILWRVRRAWQAGGVHGSRGRAMACVAMTGRRTWSV